MKIAIIGSRGIDANYSGIEKGLRELCPRLVKRGHEIYVFSQDSNEILKNPKTYQGVNIVRVPSLNGKHTETLSRTALSILKCIGKNFDVINLRAEGPGIFSIVPRIMGNKCAVTIHGLDWKREKWSATAKVLLRISEMIAARFSNQVIVVSKTLQRYFKETYGRETVYIPNGIVSKMRKTDTKAIKSFGLNKNEYILFASRLVPEKGCHELIQAYNNIETNKKLVIAGGARYEDSYIRSLKRIAAPNRIVFTGHVGGNLLEELFSHAYFFVLPSHIEGLSNALLEALGYNKCVLVSDIPENIEVIEGYGHSFRVGDIASLRAKLSELLTNEKLVRETERKLGSLIDNEYNWDYVAERYDEAFSSLLGVQFRRV